MERRALLLFDSRHWRLQLRFLFSVKCHVAAFLLLFSFVGRLRSIGTNGGYDGEE
jgi:hypothetical protein